MSRITFLNTRQAEHGYVGQTKLSRDYVLACRFFHCGIIDRTGTLDQGFPYRVLDPIPTIGAESPSFAELCDANGARVVSEAVLANRNISVLWSGGIDSTCALIAVAKAAQLQGYTAHIRVLLSASSIHEYPGYFLRHIDGMLPIQPVRFPISAYLDPESLIVTGEHGDQLFGSHLLRTYVERGVAHFDYREILPLVMLERLRNPYAARRVMRYLTPVIDAAPVSINSLFDCMWWFNFALKWQDVALRMASLRSSDAPAVVSSLRHFFRGVEFQNWALANTPGNPVPTWSGYKEVAKRYILDHTGDEAYFRSKEKEDSLRNVFAHPEGGSAVRAFMREEFVPIVEVIEPRRPFHLRGALKGLNPFLN